MKIILEGCDCTGKTTLAKKLFEKYFDNKKISYLHFSYKDRKDYNFYNIMLEKNNFIADRHFLSEIIYQKIFSKKIRLFPNETKKIPLGFGLELPDGYCALIVPRSGQATKGIICQIPPIDSGYRGEIHAIVTNTTNEIFFLEKDERVGQILIIPCILAEFCDNLGEERGIGAFNSTGK